MFFILMPFKGFERPMIMCTTQVRSHTGIREFAQVIDPTRAVDPTVDPISYHRRSYRRQRLPSVAAPIENDSTYDGGSPTSLSLLISHVTLLVRDTPPLLRARTRTWHVRRRGRGVCNYYRNGRVGPRIIHSATTIFWWLQSRYCNYYYFLARVQSHPGVAANIFTVSASVVI